MRPRTTKGPSWANEARVEQPVPPSEEPNDHPSTNSALLSDTEWMKQRIAQNIENEGKVFEQSDEEDGRQGGSTAPEVGVLVFLARGNH